MNDAKELHVQLEVERSILPVNYSCSDRIAGVGLQSESAIDWLTGQDLPVCLVG